jgi:membrane-associated phospholipid phosphatase
MTAARVRGNGRLTRLRHPRLDGRAPADRPIVETDPRRVTRQRAVLLVAGALGLAVATIRGRGRLLDDRLFGTLNSRYEHPVLDAFFRSVTELGSLWASIGAAGLIAARGRRRPAVDALGAAVAMWLVGQGLKQTFRRVRPYDARLPRPIRLLIGRPLGTSWPSAHPATFLAFVTVAARDLEVPRSGRRALAGLAGVVAASRVYLGVHYPADVVGGLLLGRAVADVWSREVSPHVVH